MVNILARKKFELMQEESKIRAKLLNIQAFLTPHLEVMQKYLNIAKDLIQAIIKCPYMKI